MSMDWSIENLALRKAKKVRVGHTGSNMANSRPMLHPGTIPGPPTKPAPTLETMFPYKLGMTMTSNCWGLETSCMEALSTIMSSNLIPELAYSLETSRQVLRKRPSANFMMLAL